MSTSWDLYIDETGDFTKPDRDVFVVALLARERSLPPAADLKAALLRCAPFAQWPLHAAIWRHPASALVWYAYRRRLTPPIARDDRLESMIACVTNSSSADHMTGTLSRLSAGGEPEKSALDRIAEALPSRQFERIRHSIDMAEAGFISIRQIAAATANRNIGKSVSLVACGEHRPGDAIDPAAHPDVAPTTRWFRLVHGLLSRVQCILIHGGGDDHEVHVRPLGLPIADPDTGQKRHLTPADVRTCFPSTVGRCRFKAEPPQSWGAHLSPEYVLADHIANALRLPLSNGRSSLAEVERLVTERSGLPVRFLASHLASMDATDVSAGEEEPNTQAKGRTPRMWALEQGAEWRAIGCPA